MPPRIWVTLAGLASIGLIVWILYFYVGTTPVPGTLVAAGTQVPSVPTSKFVNMTWVYGHLGRYALLEAQVPACRNMLGTPGFDSSTCGYTLHGTVESLNYSSAPTNTTLCLSQLSSSIHLCQTGALFDLQTLAANQRFYAGPLYLNCTTAAGSKNYFLSVIEPIGVS